MIMINSKVHDQEDCAQEGFCDYSSEIVRIMTSNILSLCFVICVLLRTELQFSESYESLSYRPSSSE